MLYFSYGSNMDLVAMGVRCPGALVLCNAKLPKHRVAFVTDLGGFDGGVATIRPDDDADVWGVLWEIDEDHLDALDKWEGYPVAYHRYPVTVVTPEPSEALVYASTFNEPQPPSERYFGDIVRGAKDNELPEEYIELLRRWATV